MKHTSQEADDVTSRTLYVRLPHTIKSSNEIKELFLGDVQIKLPRQSSRHCHVVFSSIEEKMKNLKNVKKMKVDGKHIIACPPKLNPPSEKKKKEKKIRIPKPKPEPRITKSLYISNIKPGTKAKAIREAFPGCVSVVMLKSAGHKTRSALVKAESIQLAGEYLRKEREWPEVNGNVLTIKLDTRKRKKTSGKEATGLKIYGEDGEDETNNRKTSPKRNRNKKSTKSDKKHGTKDSQKTKDSQESENSQEAEDSQESENFQEVEDSQDSDDAEEDEQQESSDGGDDTSIEEE